MRTAHAAIIAAMAVWFVGSSPTPAAPEEAAEPDELVGYWWATEKPASEDAAPRVGMVSVVASKTPEGKKAGYVVSWVYGRELSQGAGERRGNLLCLAWSNGPGKVGVLLYEIHGSGKGLTINSDTETWTRAKLPIGT